MLDDDEWDDMPIVHSSRDADEEEDRRKNRYVPPARLDVGSNAVGASIDTDVKGDWREKGDMDEEQYTRLELDDDPDEDEVHMRTQYLFDDDKDMTPLSQMQATKDMLSEAQRIAYVGLCRLVTREMLQMLRRGKHKELEPAAESLQNWATKIMGRLYYHMELNPAEQRMIEQLAEHGVMVEDLTPSLIATHTVANPEYDPKAAEEARLAAQEEEAKAEEEAAATPTATPAPVERHLPEPADLDDGGDLGAALDDEDDGDIGGALTSPKVNGHFAAAADSSPPSTPVMRQETKFAESPFDDYVDHADVTAFDEPAPKSVTATPEQPPKPSQASDISEQVDEDEAATEHDGQENLIQPLPSTLPGVSTTLTAADKTVTLDIRWTILCDLFLALVADSVYDARSRVLLGTVAERLGLTWLDVVRFERRLTEALEISESVKQRENVESIDDRKKRDVKRRYVMMGAAALGGGLVIGLSAGLLAPVIGAGLGAAFTTIGVTGTTGFLAGAGGAAIITTGGVLTGANIASRGMARRTRSVSTFRFLPLHNNKRASCYITVPGFMAGPADDVRLPFSVLDPVIGDVFSVLWEPEMMGDTGNALRILTGEVLTQVGQQVLQATLLTALLSAMQWPIMLTKLGYLIDNPWSNALDRAKAAGALLADILIKRDVGVRPVSLIGFSLGARVIFYALVELAKAKAYGVVQDVYLMGATVTANMKTWRSCSSVVSGRFVNAYARNDWVLGYLFRATSGGIGTVAGLRPVENIPNLENIDVTDIVVGHMSYRSTMPVILQLCGFKITRDTFDEPEDLSEMPDREIVSEQELARRQEAKAKKGFFASWRKQPRSASGPSLNPAKPPPAGRVYSGDISKHTPITDDDLDDLPPREEGPSFDVHALKEQVAKMAEGTASTDSLPVRGAVPHPVPVRSVSADQQTFPTVAVAEPTEEDSRTPSPVSREATPEPSSPAHPEASHVEREDPQAEEEEDDEEEEEQPPRATLAQRSDLPQWQPYAQPAESAISFAGDDGEITFESAQPGLPAWSKPISPKADNPWGSNPW